MSKGDDVLNVDTLKRALEKLNENYFNGTTMATKYSGIFIPPYVVYSSLVGKYIDARTGKEWNSEEDENYDG